MAEDLTATRRWQRDLEESLQSLAGLCDAAGQLKHESVGFGLLIVVFEGFDKDSPHLIVPLEQVSHLAKTACV